MNHDLVLASLKMARILTPLRKGNVRILSLNL